MNAAAIAHALGGRKGSTGWTTRCPAHDDRNPSLSIREAPDGKVLVRCHAGCEQVQVIAALKARGLWPSNDQYHAKTIRLPSRQPSHRQRDGEADRTAAALTIWQSAAPATDTLVETYLKSRGINITPPASLRFHPALPHPSGGLWPAMIALVTRGANDEPVAIHRTFLSGVGTGKAPVAPVKMMLGPCHAGAVRFGVPGEVLMIGEGIETCLAAMQGSGKPAWAALSTSGLRSLQLPEDVCDVILLADGDCAGEAAAQHAALRWKRQSRRVRIARPPRGMDFNDLLVGHAPCVKEETV
jgi:putative DNA primase/helicase